MFRHLKCHPQGAHCALLKGLRNGCYSHYANLLSLFTVNMLLQFIILYFNDFILPRPRYLYVILVRHNELPEDDILNVETCRSMLFIIIVFYITVQSLVKL